MNDDTFSEKQSYRGKPSVRWKPGCFIAAAGRFVEVNLKVQPPDLEIVQAKVGKSTQRAASIAYRRGPGTEFFDCGIRIRIVKLLLALSIELIPFAPGNYS